MSNALRGIAVLLSGSLGCAGAYAELAVTKLAGSKVTPDSGGDGVEVAGGTIVGFNLGIEFSNMKKRFGMGYVSDSTSYEGGDGSFTGMAIRYDHTIMSLAERATLQIGGGTTVGTGTGTYNGTANASEGVGLGLLLGVGGTYYPTFRTPVHVMFGVERASRPAGNDNAGMSASDVSIGGIGFTARIAVSLSARDHRPDASFVVPLEGNRDITGVIERGAAKLGCSTEDVGRTSYSASLEVRCDGKRIEYFQIAQGILITCKHEASESRCRALSDKIVASARSTIDKPSEPAATPAATPAAAPAPAPAPAPTPDPAPAPEAPAAPAAPAPSE